MMRGLEMRLIGAVGLCILATTSGVEAQDVRLGRSAYASGNYSVALENLKPLAEQGDSSAQTYLGWMYRNGEGVPQDYAESIRWFRLSAAQGVAVGQYLVGDAYMKGEGVEKDYKEAIKWIRLAAEQAYSSAMYSLGEAYESGYGVDKDKIKAHMWFNLAAAQGFVFSDGRRDKIAENMKPSDLEEAQRLATICFSSEYKNCD